MITCLRQHYGFKAHQSNVATAQRQLNPWELLPGDPGVVKSVWKTSSPLVQTSFGASTATINWFSLEYRFTLLLMPDELYRHQQHGFEANNEVLTALQATLPKYG